MKTGSPDHGGRVACLDDVRCWSVLGVVVLHACMSQLTFSWGWAVEDPRQTKAANWLVALAASFAVPTLFFLAGYFALPSLRPKGPWRFAKAKLWRLVVPGFLVVVFLNPVFRYIFHYTRSFSGAVPRMSYWEYWPQFFQDAFSVQIWVQCTPWTAEFHLMHVWFVSLLMVFFLMTALAYKAASMSGSAADRMSPEPAKPPSFVRTLALVTLGAVVGMCALNCVVPPEAIISLGPCLSFICPYVVLHACYYCLGMYAYRREWFGGTRALGPPLFWLLACCIFYVIDIALMEHSLDNTALAASLPFRGLLLCADSFLGMSVLGMLLSLGVRSFARPSTFRRHLAANSYRIYLLHFAIVILVQFLFLHWPGLPPLVVLVCVSGLSLALSYLAAVVFGWAVAWMTPLRRPIEVVPAVEREHAFGANKDTLV